MLNIPKKWQLTKRTEEDLIRQILVNRGIKDTNEQESFLNPNFERDFLYPYLLKDMRKAVIRIIKAMNTNEQIGIFGDYDADGIPATALLVRVFGLLKYQNINPVIPNREDGYGINQAAVDLFLTKKCSLIIILDNGIAAKEVVKYAKDKGIETVVIDHHEVQKGQKPTSGAIINPKQSTCSYPDKTLCASALTFKLAWALFISLGKNTNQLKWLLDLVAISTIADLVPLLGESRLLAKFGLIVLNKTKNLGLQKIYHNAELELGKIDAYHVGFIIAPRINAPSRMGKEKDEADAANMILKLLTTDDEKEASRLAKIVSDLNKERQEALKKATNEAIKLAEKQVKKNRRTIVLVDSKWPTGVVGLVAGQLVESFARPAFVFGQIDLDYVGSARSIKKFDLVANLSAISSTVKKFGGHKLAAGLTVDPKKYEQFCTRIENQAQKTLSEEDLVRTIKIDSTVHLREASISFANSLKKLAPFGMATPQPIFLLRGKFSDPRLMGKDGSHLSFWLDDGNSRLKVVAFGHAQLADQLQSGDEIEILANLKIDTWNNIDSVRLFYIDHRVVMDS